jgi:hypothetical protein
MAYARALIALTLAVHRTRNEWSRIDGEHVCRQLGISEATFYVWKKR